MQVTHPVSVSHISHGFNGSLVLDDVSFQLAGGAFSGLIGPSGGGKSVLMKIIGGVMTPLAGAVTHSFQLEEVGLMFQEGALFDSLSVLDNVAFPLVDGFVPVASLPYRKRQAVTEQVEEILLRVGLEHAARKMPAQLSGGMRRRVSLARALVDRPKLVLLDDPTCGLDPVASSVIMELIQDLHGELGSTMLLVSHDLRRLLPLVSQLLVLRNGRIEFDGTVEDLSARASSPVKEFVSCRYDLNGAERYRMQALE